MTSVKKAIKIYARLKPSDSSSCQYEIDKHVNDDGSIDDILMVNSSNSMNALNNNAQDDYQDYQQPGSACNRPDTHKFRFSKVFDESCTQDLIFSEICQPVLESALQGYNSTIFAYGQTGSGKTYTMTGSRQQWKNRGIIPRSLSYIFDKFNDLTEQGYIASAFLSYLEIYNENGYDLLHSGFTSGRIEDLRKVQLLEDSQQQIHMRNLTVHPIKSEDEAMQLLYLGDHNRIIAETPMNETSTRSHCIFTIHINIREGTSSTVRRSKVHLVDLAGSERLANSQSTGQLFNEARHINLTLHYLEQVIVALGESNRSHIPYRNSVMTSILRDSLGGNCMTSMVATLSMEHRNILETLSTCRFSQRVALVQNAAMLNEETDPMLLIAQLKAENKRLKDIIANSSIKNLEFSTSNPLTQEEVGECWRLVERFVAESDDEATLPVTPDMRMVQTCFRCLKTAVQINSSKNELLTGGSLSSVLSSATDSNNKYGADMTREQLVECLRIRDAEIDVLKKIVKPHFSRSSRKKASPFLLSSGGPASHYEYGDGPQPVQQMRENGGVEITTMATDCNAAGITDHSLINGNVVSGIGDLPYNLERIGIDQSISSTTEQEFFPYGVTLEEFSQHKKQALDSFKRSYKGAEKMSSLRKSLSAKRIEVDSIECLLKRNRANLKNLTVVLLSSEGGPEEEDLFMKDAVQSQTQSIQKQERQLMKTKEELKQVEENLKSLYAKFFNEFENQWVSMREFRQKSGIPSDIDLYCGEDNTHIEPSRAADINDASLETSGKGGKPFTELTTGIMKGVGGISPRSHKSARHRSFNQSINNQFIITATPPSQMRNPVTLQSAHVSKSCYAQPPMGSIVTSARKSCSSTRGKQTPANSPRLIEKYEHSPRSKPISQQYGKPSQYSKSHCKCPPSSPPTPIPASPSISAPPIQLLHRHHLPEFPSEQSTDNFATSYRPPSYHLPEEFAPKPNSAVQVEYDKDDEELIKDLPMTGDASVDQEILSFFTRRQAIFRQINGDKNPNKPGEKEGGGCSARNNSHHDNSCNRGISSFSYEQNRFEGSRSSH